MCDCDQYRKNQNVKTKVREKKKSNWKPLCTCCYFRLNCLFFPYLHIHICYANNIKHEFYFFSFSSFLVVHKNLKYEKKKFSRDQLKISSQWRGFEITIFFSILVFELFPVNGVWHEANFHRWNEKLFFSTHSRGGYWKIYKKKWFF